MAEQLVDFGDIVCTITICKKTCVADAVKAVWQNVDQETTNELMSGKCHGLLPLCGLVTIILPFEGDIVTVGRYQPAVGYRHPMSVAGKIGQHGLGSGKGLLGINDPFSLSVRSKEASEVRGIRQTGVLCEELQFIGFMSCCQFLQKQSSEQA